MFESSENLRKRFKSVFKELKRFMNILENLWQSSEIFEKQLKRSKMVLKFSEKLRKCFKSVFQMFLLFFKFFGKSSGVFENHRKISAHDRNCS